MKMKPRRMWAVVWHDNKYPDSDSFRWSRQDCIKYLGTHGYRPPYRIVPVRVTEWPKAKKGKVKRGTKK